jgi:hypothetical protein
MSPATNDFRSAPASAQPSGPPIDLPAPGQARWRSRHRGLWLAALGALLVVAGAFATATGVFGGNAATTPAVTGPRSAPFHLAYPRTWHPLDATQLAQLPGPPLAVLRRTDGHGTLVVAERPALTTPLERLPQGLKRSLGRQFTDFREIGAKLVTLHGTRALVYTFARTRSGTAQSVVVVPAGNHSFTLNAVLPRQSPEAAREVGAMIASFDPNGAH